MLEETASLVTDELGAPLAVLVCVTALPMAVLVRLRGLPELIALVDEALPDVDNDGDHEDHGDHELWLAEKESPDMLGVGEELCVCV